MRNLNETVVSWLEQGKIREALLGKGDFFLADHTYRSYHDILLVIYVLICWAVDTFKVEETSEKFEKILLSLSVSDPWKCADVLLAYTIKAKGLKNGLPCNFSKIFNSLANHLPSAKQKDENLERTANGTLKNIQKRFKQIGVEVNI